MEKNTNKIPAILFILAIILALSAHSFADKLYFQEGASIANSNIDGTKGSDWSDAFSVQSGDPGINSLPDWDGATFPAAGNHVMPTLSKRVKIYAKRDASFNLYLAFEVQDQTQNLQPGGGPLPNGEKIIIQFDPNNSGGGQLSWGSATSAKDYRLEITHKWSTTSGFTTQFFDSDLPSGNSACMKRDWELVTPTPSGIKTAYGPITGGYFIEIKIPASELGVSISTTDFGLAVAVVNDLGFCVTSFDCDATGITFPATLPLTNTTTSLVNDPVYPTNCDWLVPNNWGKGTFLDPAGQVTIWRSPEYWRSEDIRIRLCNEERYSLDYYKDLPCKTQIKATLHNTSATNQIRNVLYLWARHGASEPGNYQINRLVRNVTLPRGDTPVLSPLIDSGIPSYNEHPCVRVYILPQNEAPSFPFSMVETISTKAELEAMIAAYGIQIDHWAQRNLHKHSTTTTCPFPGCAIRAGLQRQFVDASANVHHLIENSPPDAISPQSSIDIQEIKNLPVVANPGHEVILTPSEREEFLNDNVIVQIRTFKYRDYTGIDTLQRQRYFFIEPLSGTLQLFPVDMLNETGLTPFQFEVGNPDSHAITILTNVDILIPSSAGNVWIAMDTKPRKYQGGEFRTVFGGVFSDKRSGRPSFALSVHAGIAFPHGDVNSIYKPGLAGTLDLSYSFSPQFSAELLFGYYQFKADSLAQKDLKVLQFAGNLKYLFPVSPKWNPFINGGGGMYRFESDSSKFGFNLGGGLQYEVSPKVALEAAYNYHSVTDTNPAFRFSTLQAVIRYRF